MQPEVLEGREVGPGVITTHGFRRGGRRCCGVTADIINNNMLISCFSPTISRRSLLHAEIHAQSAQNQQSHNSLCQKKKTHFH